MLALRLKLPLLIEPANHSHLDLVKVQLSFETVRIVCVVQVRLGIEPSVLLAHIV